MAFSLPYFYLFALKMLFTYYEILKKRLKTFVDHTKNIAGLWGSIHCYFIHFDDDHKLSFFSTH